MTTYTRTNRMVQGAEYRYDDRVVFHVGQQEIVYEISGGSYLSNVTSDGVHHNDEVFRLLDLDPYETFRKVNGFESNDWRPDHDNDNDSRNWPECDGSSRTIPYPLANLVNYLFDCIDSRMSGASEELQPLGLFDHSQW